MADYSRDDAAYATRIVERLINREGEGLELEQDIIVSDVESDATLFSEELSLLQEFDADVPALLISGVTVPVSLGTALGFDQRSPFSPFGLSKGAFKWHRHPFWYEAMYDLLRPIRKREKSNGFISMNRQEGRATFIRLAANFLAT